MGIGAGYAKGGRYINSPGCYLGGENREMSTDLAQHIHTKLQEREQQKALRAVVGVSSGIDFVTNDYLGFAQQKTEIPLLKSGSGASRLLGGTTHEILELEK